MSEDYVSITRRGLLGSAVAVAAAMVTGGPATAATAVARPRDPGQVPTIWREFTRTPSPTRRSRTSAGPAIGAGRRASPPPRRGRRPRLRRRRGRHHGLRARDQPCHRRCREGRRWHGAHPARHLPHRRPDPHRPLERRAARRRQRPYEAVRDQEPHRADRCLRLPLRRRQVVLVLGGRPHLARAHGPLGLLVAAIKDKAWPFEGWTGNKRDEWETLTTVAPPPAAPGR